MSSVARAKAGKTFRSGTHRTISLRETLQRVRPFASEMGIIRVANVTGLDVIGIPAVMVVRPNSRCPSVAQGKGIDIDCAKASGVMEAVEQYLAEHIELPLRLASHGELASLATSARLVEVAKAIFYGQRTFDHVPATGRREGLPAKELNRLARWLEYHDNRVDQKRLDALELLHEIGQLSSGGRQPPSVPAFQFRYTESWQESWRQATALSRVSPPPMAQPAERKWR
jgi:hypothetical protein